MLHTIGTVTSSYLRKVLFSYLQSEELKSTIQASPWNKSTLSVVSGQQE